MTVFEAISIIILFAIFVLALLTYLKK
ncbi:putative holin-like toxin [Veillonella sp. oral taxon 780]